VDSVGTAKHGNPPVQPSPYLKSRFLAELGMAGIKLCFFSFEKFLFFSTFFCQILFYIEQSSAKKKVFSNLLSKFMNEEYLV
jgi:hypothetical protein